jgi:hypothetical protein
MTVKDPNGFALRRRVARHLRKFYAEWTAQLAAGTSEIWNLVEYRLAIKNEAEGTAPHAGTLPRTSAQASPKKT